MTRTAFTNEQQHTMTNEMQIRNRVEAWIRSIQEHDIKGILAWHHPHIAMYDVPPPFQSNGLDAYRKTWEEFLPALEKGAHAFQLMDLQITAGEDVAIAYSPMKCVYQDKATGRTELDFRLTIGFKKIDGEWWFIHEHHSIPADN